jgi:ABC-type multidrug transport system fused ATPase/permease subunit
MIEIIKDLLKTSSSRIKNPILSSFLISFTIYNWKAVLILLFANCDIEAKISHIEIYYSSFGNIIIPIIISIFYITLIPYINNFFDYVLKPSKNRKNEYLKNSIIEDLKIEKERAKYEREIAEEKAGTSEINNLKEQLNSLTEEKNKLNELIKDSYNERNNLLEENNKRIKEYENKLSSKEYFMPRVINTIHNELKEYERDSLMKFYRYFKLNQNVENAINLLNDDIITRFRHLNLVENKNDLLSLTKFGEAVAETFLKQYE